eukprot:CAMPEP_0169141276 /NCGR_PEP_ID=MMETSP1015-20121227/44206_1 /TAXON_ID=342587 /ORGANISM="Karlodinium micrum, Strain CCMP2283" /LENGTH=39 /DNA_ID= /DNA_START= /DNA_END= /DNA_ORIENTATION=
MNSELTAIVLGRLPPACCDADVPDIVQMASDEGGCHTNS